MRKYSSVGTAVRASPVRASIAIAFRGLRKQSGRMIELQILIAAVLIAVAVFIPQFMSGEGFFKALLVSIAWVVGIVGSLLALAFLGALPGMVRDWYTTPVAVRAARKRNALKALQAMRPNRLDTRATDRFGDTPLHVICDSYEEERKRDAPAVVDFLLLHGAEVNAKNTHDKTALDLAVEHDYGIETVKRLLAAGARPHDALHQAASISSEGAIQVVRALLDAGVSAGARNVLGDTPLHQAARFGTPEVVGELLSRGADVNARDRGGDTPLHEALWMPSLRPEHVAKIVAVLVAAGADRDAVNRSGSTPRALAEKSGEAAVIAAMSSAGGG